MPKQRTIVDALQKPANIPLAEKVRPQTIGDILGQSPLLKKEPFSAI
jgi:replication-associated recombination protein RarA